MGWNTFPLPAGMAIEGGVMAPDNPLASISGIQGGQPPGDHLGVWPPLTQGQTVQMNWPGYSLADFIKERRAQAKELLRDAKTRADQIEHEMNLLERAVKP
jgi:hypothetical protein